MSRRKPVAVAEEITPSKPRFIQILAAEWDGDTGRNSSIYGLTNTGRVYRFRASLQAWVPLPTRVLREVNVEVSPVVDDDIPF